MKFAALRVLGWVAGALLFSPGVLADDGSIADSIAELGLVTGASRRNMQVVVAAGTAADPIQMVADYIKTKYVSQPSLVAGYEIIPNSDRLLVDTVAAGTITSGVAFDAVRGNARAEALVRKISDQGGLFGFDGHEQNSCGIATPYLLVLDPAAQRVHGIDLSPCQGE